MSLSERFTQLKSAPKIATAGRAQRQTEKVVLTKDKRSAQTNAKRGLAPQQRNGNQKSGAPKGKLAIKKVAVGKGRRGPPGGGRGGGAPTDAPGGRKGGARGRVAGGGKKNIKGGRKGGKDDKSKKPVDLDKDMDDYWFKAGKGPNPVVASLDRDMDDYFKGKSSDAAPAGAVVVSADAAAAVSAAVDATATATMTN